MVIAIDMNDNEGRYGANITTDSKKYTYMGNSNTQAHTHRPPHLAYLPHLSLTHTSPTTHPSLTHTSSTTHPSHTHVPHPSLTHTSPTTHPSHPSLTHTSPTSHPSFTYVPHPSFTHLTLPSPTPHPSLTHTSPSLTNTSPPPSHIPHPLPYTYLTPSLTHISPFPHTQLTLSHTSPLPHPHLTLSLTHTSPSPSHIPHPLPYTHSKKYCPLTHLKFTENIFLHVYIDCHTHTTHFPCFHSNTHTPYIPYIRTLGEPLQDTADSRFSSHWWWLALHC